MKVFCPEHNRDFLAPRRNPIRCENRNHVLGDFDFEGRGQPPVGKYWVYCCNCEHFWPSSLDCDNPDQCPVCQRSIQTRYLCALCFTMCLDALTSITTKNFTLTREGTPHPSCPGCLQAVVGPVDEHVCRRLSASFNTALRICPICGLAIANLPAFPASVSECLKRIKPHRQVIATFDYQKNLFVAAEEGEFILVHDGNGLGHLMVLPRQTHFSTRRDHYNQYEDFYYCANPVPGELQIVQPALVTQVTGGWKLTESGVIETLPETPATVDVPESAAFDVSHSSKEKIEQQPISMKTCPGCGSPLVESRYAFCWNCGRPVPGVNPTVSAPVQPVHALSEDDERTLSSKPEIAPTQPPIFAWALQRDAEPTLTKTGGKKLIAAALIILIVAFLLFLLFRALARRGTTAEISEAPQQINQPAIQTVAPEGQTPAALTTKTADEELEELSERARLSAENEQANVVAAFKSAEEKYPNDYRFPYEQAKVVINKRETRSHDEAFAAVLRAAEKAIESNKADEMLDRLSEDKDGDFYKLSRGHGEWQQLEEALRRKDKRALKTNGH